MLTVTMSKPRLMLNMARCKVCKTVCLSLTVHDFRTCKCGEMNVDGGNEYCKRGAKNLDNVEELSVYLHPDGYMKIGCNEQETPSAVVRDEEKEKYEKKIREMTKVLKEAKVWAKVGGFSAFEARVDTALNEQ